MPLRSPKRLAAALRRLGFWDGIWFGGGLWGVWHLVVHGNRLGGLVALLCLPPALFLLAAHRWAWHVSVFAWGCFLVLFTGLAAEAGFGGWWIVAVLAICAGLATTIHARPRYLAHAAEDPAHAVDDPVGHKHSLVLWLRAPLPLDEERLSAIASRAFRRRFNEKGGECFLIGKGVNHVLRFEDLWFLVLHIERPYLDDPAHSAQLPPETRERAAALGHRAWVAIDLMTAARGVPDGRIEDAMGRFLAELAASEGGVVALLHPTTGRLVPWHEGLAAELASGDPLAVFALNAR